MNATEQQLILDYLAACRAQQAACERLRQLADLLSAAAAVLKDRCVKFSSDPPEILESVAWPMIADLRAAIGDCQSATARARQYHGSIPAGLRAGLAEPPREPAP